jgi:protein ImuB
MSRFACVVVPRFPIAALLRVEPELRGCPLVVCLPEGGGSGRTPGPRSTLVEVSAEAERLGIRVEMTVAQALVRHADLVVRPRDERAATAARAALVDVAGSVSPRVEAEGNAVYLDTEGLERIFPSDGTIAAALASRAERIGLAVGVGVAASKATSRIAAGLAARRGEAILVPPGGDAAWLAPRPLTVLAAVPVVMSGPRRSGRPMRWPVFRDRLERLGLRRVGDLARLPRREVLSRFGREGLRFWEIAAGRDGAPLRPEPSAPDFAEGVVFEYAVDSIEALLFSLRGLLDRLMQRLGVHGLSCKGLRITLDLAEGGHAERSVGVLAPTVDVKALTMLSRHTIEADPPSEAIVAMRVVALTDRPRPTQMDLFRPAGPAPEKLATTLVRLAALCGVDRVGRPVPPKGYRPEGFSLAAFDPSEGEGEGQEVVGEPVRGARAALRALRPARPAQVFSERGQIAYVRAQGLGGRAVTTGGPWRIEGQWWSENPCRRDYYDVELSDGGVYRIYRDLDATGPGGRWFVDGSYD